MRILYFFSITLTFFFFECSYFKNSTKEITISRKYILNCETGEAKCDPIKEKIKKGETLIVNLPSGGTETKILIKGPNNITEDLNGNNALFQYKIKVAGEYFFSYFSCGLGGHFTIQVIQED